MKIKHTLLLASAMTAVAPAFDNNSGWKTDADGKIETDSSGNPLYVDDDGNTTPVKFETAVQLRGEAKSHRERAERAEAELKKFEGLDPEAARAAITATKDIKAGDELLHVYKGLGSRACFQDMDSAYEPIPL